MKTITINISNKVFTELRTNMGIRCLSGESYSVIDSFVIKIIKAIEDSNSKVDIKFKGEEDDDILSSDVSNSS